MYIYIPVYVYIYTYIFTYMYIYIYVYIDLCLFARTGPCMCVRMHVPQCRCVSTPPAADVLSGSGTGALHFPGLFEQWAGGPRWWNSRVVVQLLSVLSLGPLVALEHVGETGEGGRVQPTNLGWSDRWIWFACVHRVFVTFKVVFFVSSLLIFGFLKLFLSLLYPSPRP